MKKLRKFLIIATFVSLCSATAIMAKTSVPDNAPRPYYLNVRVNEGDNIWKIAAAALESTGGNSKNATTKALVNEIMRENNLKSDLIKEGQYLIIPITPVY